MSETDLWLMTGMTFTPTLFALLLLLVPSSNREALRWTALIGTAVTMVLSLMLFVEFQQGRLYETTLEQRADAANAAQMVRERPGGGATGYNPPSATDGYARVPWIPKFNIDYAMGIDGISMPLILLTTALTFLSMIASWGIEKSVKGYCMLFLLLETGMVGCFLALDFFLFYIFWEVMLLPMYFLIGIWGGPRREYAAIKFFLYTLLGSVFILIAMLAFFFTDARDFVAPEVVKARAVEVAKLSGKTPADADQFVKDASVNSFDILLLHKLGRAAAHTLHGDVDKVIAEAPSADKDGMKKRIAGDPENPSLWFFQPWFQITMFVLLFVGFAIKVPVFPFHTWLPDAHVEAPTPISMILAGVLLKLGGYGILRIAYPICPWAAEYLAYPLAWLGVINIVYGAFAAMAQTDFKKLVAYSSVSHMGYVILGIAVWSSGTASQFWSWGMNGAMFQMIAHGVTSAGMFFLVGVIYDRAHHRNLDNFRGLFEPMPVYSGFGFLIFFAALGLPGMCGFVGEFFVVLSAWNFDRIIAFLAALTVVLTAAYVLWTVQRVFLGSNPAYKDYPDMSLRELIIGIPLLVFSVLLGIFPQQLLLFFMEPNVTGLVQSLSSLGGK